MDLTIRGMGWERIFTLVLIWCFGAAAAVAVLAAEAAVSCSGGDEERRRRRLRKAEAIRAKCEELRAMVRDFAEEEEEEGDKKGSLQNEFAEWCVRNLEGN